MCGAEQAVNSCPSSEHSNAVTGVPLTSKPENVNVALVSVVSEFGPESIDVSGAETSITVQLRVAGVGSTLPASSTARTANVCAPASSTSTSSGTEQLSNGPPSTEHSKSSSSAAVWSSAPVNSNSEVKLPVCAPGPAVIVVSGPVVSGPSTTSHS